MAKTIFEQMGGTYTQVGDYLLPDLKPPKKKNKQISAYGLCDTSDFCEKIIVYFMLT